MDGAVDFIDSAGLLVGTKVGLRRHGVLVERRAIEWQESERRFGAAC